MSEHSRPRFARRRYAGVCAIVGLGLGLPSLAPGQVAATGRSAVEPTQVQPAPAAAPRQRAAPGRPLPEGSLIKVTGVDITGATAISPSRLRSVIATRAGSRWPWARKRYFDRRVFEADIRRIEAFYVDRGYPQAHVVSFDADLAADERAIALALTIDEGRPVIVDRVELSGFDALSPDARAALERRLPLQPGAVRDRALVTAAEGVAVRTLQNQGYPFAAVAAGERPADTASRVTLVLRATPGDTASYGAVSIEGNTEIGEAIIRRSLAIKEGDPFSLSAVQQSQQRLYESELFQLANVSLGSEAVVDGQVPVRVAVAEAKHRQIRFSAGYGSEERLRGEAEWKHLNFFGGARTGRVQGKWSSLDRGVRTEFRQPYVFSPKVALNLSAERWFADEPAYQLDTVGGRATITRELTRRDVITGRGGVSSLSGSVIYSSETFAIAPAALADLTFRSQLLALGLDPRTGEGQGILGAVAVDFRRSTTAGVLDGTRGYIVELHAERAGGALPGNYQYTELGLDARHYQTIGRFGVIAHRARISTIDGPGPGELGVPFFKRYFLGGSNSLRGWGRFEVAPLSGSGLPLGGHSLVELSSELRAAAFGRISLVAFVDAGSVAVDAWSLPLTDLRYDAGPGLRYLTPIGPLRADLAFQLNPVPGLLIDGVPERRRWRVHFSIGQAF